MGNGNGQSEGSIRVLHREKRVMGLPGVVSNAFVLSECDETTWNDSVCWCVGEERAGEEGNPFLYQLPPPLLPRIQRKSRWRRLNPHLAHTP